MGEEVGHLEQVACGRGGARGKIHCKLGDDSDNPTYIFTEPRVGYRMPRGETGEGETECLSPRGCAGSRVGITLCEAAMAGLLFTATLRR